MEESRKENRKEEKREGYELNPELGEGGADNYSPEMKKYMAIMRQLNAPGWT